MIGRFIPLQMCRFVKAFFHKIPSFKFLNIYQTKRFIFSSNLNFAYPKVGVTQIPSLVDLQGNQFNIAKCEFIENYRFFLFLVRHYSKKKETLDPKGTLRVSALNKKENMLKL
jgi:hypothetical protein